VWVLLWGASFAAQARTTHASWIGPTTAAGVVRALSSLITTQRGVTVLVAIVVAAGIAVALRTEQVLARLMLCLGVLPLAAAALIGVVVPFFIDRTLTVSAWVPCLALGLAVQWAWSRSRAMGVAVALTVAVLVLPAAGGFLRRQWEYDASVDHLLGVVRSGDVVATVPDWYGPLVDWRVGVRAFGTMTATEVPDLPSAHAIRVGDRSPTGRVWILSFSGDHRTFPGLTRCAPRWSDGVTDVTCIAPE
jgi:hypothetical protein